jgi:hypothetical protein
VRTAVYECEPGWWPVRLVSSCLVTREAMLHCMAHPSSGRVELMGSLDDGNPQLAFELEHDAVWFRMSHPEMCR